METIRSGTCSIHIGDNPIEAIASMGSSGDYSSIFILVDSNTEEYCLPVFIETYPVASGWQTIRIPAGERHKNLYTCLEVWKELSTGGADRNSLLVNLGGGVVTDLGGFVACTYQRGIRFINMPTTLLSMVDASVGGKTGVDLGNLKNQIGVIENPLMVGIHPGFLRTLDARELRSGFAEMLKHGLILDRSYWDSLKQLDLKGDLRSVIHKSVRLKNSIVLADPLEQNQRKILNFGHTLGHAIESFYMEKGEAEALLHGEAIAAGMILEAYLSVKACGLPPSECDEIRDTVLSFFPSVPISADHWESILGLLRFDKKNTGGSIRFSLLERIGKAVYNKVVSVDQLHAALDYYKE